MAGRLAARVWSTKGATSIAPSSAPPAGPRADLGDELAGQWRVAVAGPAPSTAAARPRCRLLSAQADGVAIRVGEYADPRLWCDPMRRVALGCTSRQQGLAGGVEILDVGKGHRPPAFTGWIEADLEAVDVVADVVRLVGVR